MKNKATFYHAGCPVCVSAEEGLARRLDPASVDLEIVHLGEQSERLAEARERGVESVPALVFGDQAFHINFGASLADLQ